MDRGWWGPGSRWVGGGGDQRWLGSRGWVDRGWWGSRGEWVGVVESMEWVGRGGGGPGVGG